jgi:hypothetical protein
MESDMRRDMEGFWRICDRMINDARQNEGVLNKEECEVVLYFVVEIENTVRPYEELDDLAAAIEIAKFHSVN